MRLHVSDLHYEWLNTIIISERDTAREYAGMIRLHTKTARPKFSRLNRRRMYRERLSLFIISGCGLEACNIWAVAKFGLRIATNDIQAVYLRQVVGLLGFASENSKRVCEHQLM